MKFFSPPTSPMINASLLVARLALFTVFITHGSQKMLGWFGGHGFQATLTGFTQMEHIPVFFALLAIFTEFFAPLALLCGLLTRLAALGLACIMIVAVAMVHLHNGFFMNWAGHQKGEGIEFFILSGALALALIISGAGDWSFDNLIYQRWRTARSAPIHSEVHAATQSR
ncbi:DoxX family protein [Dictyobacter kobayashii]|uniref:DoxX family protein n=1 Tax=Dictyobacter kobayashii TaxID=2014872 RepID=A0A402AU50_9CHLR|nr:DoxX family protein [Dictyobacter kobayashii]GCE22650.1 hypothetical protein KDK_64500 [Dictyobacter kobayashii]